MIAIVEGGSYNDNGIPTSVFDIVSCDYAIQKVSFAVAMLALVTKTNCSLCIIELSLRCLMISAQ